MQVFGLPGHVIGNARGASRLLAAQSPNIEAARRRDALASGHGARADRRPGGVAIKHFTAHDPFAKWTVTRPCEQTTAKNAADFLEAVLEQMPDPAKAIQVDG